MATGLNRLGTSAYTNTPPAIVQKAKRDWKFYQSAILKLDEDRGKLLHEYKEGGTWKEHYKTWVDACVPLNISARQADRLIQLEVSIRTECPNVDDKKEEKALSQVEKAREATPEPEKEEDEKPAVHSADEAKPEPAKPHTNGHQPKQNGKPKTQLPIWKEIEDDLIGKAYRRVDDLNRVCPNPVHHKRLISALKMAHGILDEWRRDTK